MQTSTTQAVQAQVQVLTAVLRGVLAELPPEGQTRVKVGLERALLAYQPMSEACDVATTQLLGQLLCVPAACVSRAIQPASNVA